MPGPSELFRQEYEEGYLPTQLQPPPPHPAMGCRPGDIISADIAAYFIKAAAAVSGAVDPHHYRRHVIEPIDFIMANNLPFWAGNVVKYVSRCDEKGDEEGDLEKAKKYIDFRLAQIRKERFCAENYKK